jgi:hypothetical protein
MLLKMTAAVLRMTVLVNVVAQLLKMNAVNVMVTTQVVLFGLSLLLLAMKIKFPYPGIQPGRPQGLVL